MEDFFGFRAWDFGFISNILILPINDSLFNFDSIQFISLRIKLPENQLVLFRLYHTE